MAITIGSVKGSVMPRLWSQGRLGVPIGIPMRRSHLDHTPRELVSFIALGAALAFAALLGVSWAAGFSAVAHRLNAVDWIWIPIALAAEAVAYIGYVLAYREVAR